MSANGLRMMVPTVWANALLTSSLTVGTEIFKPGDIIKVPYGVALQGLATGTFTAIQDADLTHADAIKHLEQFGPDSWFPPQVQTIHKLSVWMEEQQRRKARDAAGDSLH